MTRLIRVLVLAALMFMANAISDVSTGLTYLGRSLLDLKKSATVLANRVTRVYPGAAGMYGLSMTIPDIQISGGAATRALNGAAVASDILSSTRTFTKSHIYIAVAIDAVENDVIASLDVLDAIADEMAYKIGLKEDSLIAGLWNQIPYEVGTLDGTSIWDPAATNDFFEPLADARKILMDNQTPQGDLIFVQGTSEAREFRKLPSVLSAASAGSNETMRTGTAPSIMGFTVEESQAIQTATLSAAAQTASPGAVNGAHLRGATTLNVSGLGTGSVKSGTTFKISGVLNATGHDVRFSVLSDATITGNSAALLIYPSLPEDVADTTAVTFAEHSSASSMNLAFHPKSIILLSEAPPAWKPGSGVSSVVVRDESTGLAVRVSLEARLLGGVSEAFSYSVSADVVAGALCVRPEWAVKVTGKV